MAGSCRTGLLIYLIDPDEGANALGYRPGRSAIDAVRPARLRDTAQAIRSTM